MENTHVKECNLLKKGERIRTVMLFCVCIFFFQVFALQAQAGITNVRVNLNMKNVTLKTVLQELEQQTDFSFYYNENQINTRRIVSVEASGSDMVTVLEKILTDCEYTIENKKIILLPNSENQPPLAMTARQSVLVTGNITDSRGEALIGASITVQGTLNGTITDIDGNFSLNVPDLNVTLVISYIGYKEKIVQLGGKNEIRITLDEDTQVLDEIVVVGYGTQRKKDLTGGIATISSERIEKVPAVHLAKRLQGQMAGLSITTSSMQPNAADGETSIRIRGEKSLLKDGGNDPLIVLDGIPFNGGMNQIDQNSVDNISVLKDASAAAIYGARAANGVILITTKKGQQGKVQVRYNGYVAVQTPEKLFDLQNGEENIAMLKEFFRDMGTAESYWSDPLEFLPSLPRENYLAGKEFDWQKELYSPAFQQEHQLSLSGGTDKSSYYASLTYTDQNGMVKNTGMEKYAATINMSQKIGNWLTVGMNTQLTQIDRGGVVPEMNQAFYLSPWSNPYNEDGSYNRYPMYTTTYWRNPYQNIDGVMDKKTNTVFTAWYADIMLPVKGLSYRTNFGYTYKHYEEGSYYGKTTFKGEPLGGLAEIKNNTYSDWTWENVVRYDRNFGRHHLDVTGMISAQKTNNRETSMTGKDYLNDENAYHNIDAAQGEMRIFSDKEETSLASYMGRINYNYDSRYLLTLTGRYDGYSAFGKNNKWAFFPSVALGWVASEEEFFKNWNLEQVDFLKVRLSYGANGNQAISAYQTLTRLSQLDYIYGDGSTFAGGLYSNPNEQIGNPNLKWETTYSFNAGLDFSLFNSRINGNIEIYSANTQDLLMVRTVPIMNGYTKMLDNIGKTNTKGFELTLNTVNIEKKDFEWSTSLIFAGNWNKIKELQEDGVDDISNKWFIGESVKVHYDYKAIGVWQNHEAEEAASYGAIPGDAKLQDTDGDGKITSEDRVIIGSRIPIWMAGLTNTFTYKNFAFSFFLNGTFDVKKENYSLDFTGRQLDKCTNGLATVNYWTPENPSNEATRLGYIPKNSHKQYIDASFVRIQDVTLSYNFPQSFTDRLSLQRLGMYVNVSNLYTFSGVRKYSNNPEEETIGSLGYAVPRTFVLGVNVTF